MRRLSALALLTLALTSAGASGDPYTDTEIRGVEQQADRDIRSLRDQEIKQLRIALGRRLAENRRGDLYLRLAEIYLEAYRTEFLLEGRVHEKRLASGRPDPTVDRSHSIPHLKRGLEACHEILRLGLRHPEMEKVYFFLGFYYGELGDTPKSQKYYGELVRIAPNSPLASEAYRELADSAFARGDYRGAARAYEVALTNSNAETRPRVLFRLAWCAYRTKQFQQAVSRMKQAIEAAKKNEKLVSIREEAFRDLALFYAETGAVDEALEYFKAGSSDYPRVLERLGQQLERNVQREQASRVYEMLLKVHPESEAAFRVSAKLVELDLKQGRLAQALKRLRHISIPSSTEENDTTVALANLKAMTRRTATENHDRFRKKKDRPALDWSEAFYSVYLERFLSGAPARGERSEIQMYLAEVKREQGKPAEASALYKGVIQHGDNRYAKQAAALWTASLAEAVQKAPKGGTEPSVAEREYVEASDQLARDLGDSPQARGALLRSAQVLAGYRTTRKEAVSRASLLVSRWPGSNEALTAARLWVQIHIDQATDANATSAEKEKGIDELGRTLQELRAQGELMAHDKKEGGKLLALIREQEPRAKVGRIALSEKDQDWGAAAAGYEEFAENASGAAEAEKALQNAVSSFQKAKDRDGTQRVLERWVARFPKSVKALTAGRAAATHFLIAGDFAMASTLFELMGAKGNDADSLETAARIREGSEQISAADRIWALYLVRYRGSPNRWGVALSLARAREREQKDAEAAQAYRYCLAGPPEYEAECGARLADLYLRNKDPGQARALYQRVATQKGSKGKGRHTYLSPFVGYCRYRMAETKELSATFEPLALPEATLKKGLESRLAFLEPLSRAYLSAVDTGGPWAVASLHRLAKWANEFALELERLATDPNQPQAKAMAAGLRQVAQPLRKKALDAWAQAFQEALSTESYAPVLPELVDELAAAHRAGFRHAQSPRGGFRLSGVQADAGSDAMAQIRARLTQTPTDALAWVDYGNLLWGESKPLLARIAYERALGLNPKQPAALNNRGVVLILSEGEEDWIAAAEAAQLWREALKSDDFFLPAKLNRAVLLSYYRLFSPARPLWEQVVLKLTDAHALEGLAMAYFGSGMDAKAQETLARATKAGGSSSSFVQAWVNAASAGPKNAKLCGERLAEFSESKLNGFERIAYTDLKRACRGEP